MTAPSPASEIDWPTLLEELRRRHGAHTVLLYGSHARGEAAPGSDLDLIVLQGGVAGRDLGAQALQDQI